MQYIIVLQTTNFIQFFTLTSPRYSLCLLTSLNFCWRPSDTIMFPASSTTRELRPWSNRSFPKKLAVSSSMTNTQSRPLSEE